MNSNAFEATQRYRKKKFTISLGLFAGVFFFLASGFISYWNTRVLLQNVEMVTHTHEVILALNNLASFIKDAETGQRGYVLTGADKYLAPYQEALPRIDESVEKISRLTADNPVQQSRVPTLKLHTAAKLRELSDTIELRRAKGFDAALAVVATDRGKAEMDALRETISDMQQEERELRIKRLNEMNEAYRTTIVSGILAALLGVALCCAVFYLMRRAHENRQRQDWLQSGQVGLATSIFGEQRVESLGENILKFMAEYCDAHAGAIFIRDSKGHFRRMATYGVPEDSDTPITFKSGDGLLGQAVKDGRTFMVRDVPEGYLSVGSALGKGNPRHLIIAPASVDDQVNAVLELGFIHPVSELAIELLERASEPVGIAVRSADYRLHLQNLLEESQRQSEELQSQGEELRVNNEELEEQSQALKESQSRLEQQQVELEQTNSQLEEQTQELEAQRDDLARAAAVVEAKAQELQMASQYKSDFLANMSHELRTPLNSSLILAKLLADNTHGNLTAEQVKFAQTIQSSGNDLLMLINDILDLSKIESGHMDIHAEQIGLERMVHDLGRVFEPLAQQKNLSFKINLATSCPKRITTDKMRLEQVLKNLLSNAIKFTDSGKVELTISQTADKRIAFEVSDTGIGIAQEQQHSIFEAFRQADGTISRKYGGTGLGLSISRELVRLLGGTLDLKSEKGKGSSFTVSMPEVYDANHIASHVAVSPIPRTELAPEPSVAPVKRWIDDDREHLSGKRRIILVIEDDEPFARILYELAHELDFQCLITNTAEEALILARQYLPSAVVLDVGLPDHSGLSVLDRLKRDPRTRHIPVHVVSAGDHAQTALSLGAVGYMIKPVKREDLADAFKKLEVKLAQSMRRILVVEDDPVQQDSVKRLLAAPDVETVGVGTAAECLELLKKSTFDCMVLDLSLPDASGYSLLDTLSKEEAYSFPPVIVYTGRDLSADEEQRLRRFSKSIIIKGAKSPERLLDEVTLFIHQVVAEMPPEQQKMLAKARDRDAVLEGRHILVVEDDVRNVYALTNILEPRGAVVHIARNGLEALKALQEKKVPIDLVLMDVMMPEMDGLTATREIRKNPDWKKLPVIMLTAKAMRDDQERCLDAGANDYMAKPLDVEKLLSLVRVWMPR